MGWLNRSWGGPVCGFLKSQSEVGNSRQVRPELSIYEMLEVATIQTM